MPKFLHTPHYKLAYEQLEGATPTVMFCHGFRSDMTGTKALALEEMCRKRGQAYLRFDCSGHGQSGRDFMDGTIGQWAQDALAMLDQLIKGDVIIVGSSMGGWIALMIALQRPDRVKGLVGIASAPDFTETLIWEKFTPNQKERLLTDGMIFAPACEGEEPYPITKKLIEEGRKHMLLKKHSHPFLSSSCAKAQDPSCGDMDPVVKPQDDANILAINCPIRLIHGMQDEDVPYQTSLTIAEKVQSKDVKVTLVKSGNHRMSEPEDLKLLTETVTQLLENK